MSERDEARWKGMERARDAHGGIIPAAEFSASDALPLTEQQVKNWVAEQAIGMHPLDGMMVRAVGDLAIKTIRSLIAQERAAAPVNSDAATVQVPISLYRAVIARMCKQRNSSTDNDLIEQLEALDPELSAAPAQVSGLDALLSVPFPVKTWKVSFPHD